MVSLPGVDYSMGYDIPSLQGGGVKFACRYIGYSSMSLPQDKILTYSESYDLALAGISIVSNWEWTADRPSINNGFYKGSHSLAYAGGVADAVNALHAHAAVGGPVTAPIYFSIDYETNGQDCVDYFAGVCSVVGVGGVGAYGSITALLYLLSQDLITYLWAWSTPPDSTVFHIVQTHTDVKMGKMTVDTDIAYANNFGQWTLNPQPPKPKWFQYPIVVPFGNSNYDAGIGGSHDLDVKPPPNYPVESIVSGVISDISSPAWGRQVCLALDNPVQGHPYFGYLHLSAVNPALALRQHVAVGDLIGWVGGGNTDAQYMGTTNPTGKNFLNNANSSSQIQVGIALHDGPSYGGAGWVNFPPIQTSLDPSQVLINARLAAAVMINYKLQQFNAVWNSNSIGVKWFGSGLYKARLAAFLANKLGACTPVQDEQTVSLDGSQIITDWNGSPIKWQRYDDGSHGEWSMLGIGHIFDALGHGV